ncbi:hypothetical protein CLOM_g2569 [Closterium sp. NIES-68]|nr:hypothetical protein CLOM_g2569 [Closterium sp. NIES-68]
MAAHGALLIPVCVRVPVCSVYCKNVHTIELLARTSSHRPNVLSAAAPTTPHHAPPPVPLVPPPLAFIELRCLWYLTASFRAVRSFACVCPGALSRPSIFLMVIAWRRTLASLALHMGRLALLDLLPLAQCAHLTTLHLVGGCLHGVGAAVLGRAADGKGGMRETWEGVTGVERREAGGLRDGWSAAERAAVHEEAARGGAAACAAPPSAAGPPEAGFTLSRPSPLHRSTAPGAGGHCQYPAVLHPSVRMLTVECTAHEVCDIAALAAMLPALQRLVVKNGGHGTARPPGAIHHCAHCGVTWGLGSSAGRQGGRAYVEEMMAVRAQLRARGGHNGHASVRGGRWDEACAHDLCASSTTCCKAWRLMYRLHSN